MEQEKNLPPSAIAQRAQWMQKLSAYRQKYIDARDEFNESSTQLSHVMDGMPHGNARTDPVANQVDRRNKAYRKYLYARDALTVAKHKRKAAMRSLNAAQKAVLTALYFNCQSRRAIAKELNRSDFWVRAQERTGLFLLELPSGWETDILP